IQTVAHSLEDIFKALFNPDLSIDPEVEALIFEGFECLRLPLTAEFTGGQVNDAEILDRAAAIFAQLQEKLGDCFGQEAYLPSSVELGFDLTLSIFEVGVNQRLDELTDALTRGNPEEVATTLRTEAEVFIGLAESLSLPGFGAIAQAAIKGLDTAPTQAVTIAEIALADFQAAQAAVLGGDRIQGGQPSLALQQLAGLTTSTTELVINSAEPVVSQNDFDAIEEKGETTSHSPFTSSPQDVAVDAQESLIESELGEVTSAANTESSVTDSHTSEPIVGEVPSVESLNNSEHEEPEHEELGNSLLETIWGGEAVLDSQTPAETEAEQANSSSAPNPHHVLPSVPASAADSASWKPMEPEVTVPPSRSFRIDSNSTPISQNEQSFVSPTVRVNVEHLEHLNSSIGELLTNQNRQTLQNEQLRTAVRSLLVRLQKHQQLLGQLQDWSLRQFIGRQRWAETGSDWQSHAPFDSLELDRYDEAQIVVQSLLEDAFTLTEATDAIDLFTSASSQSLEKQRRLLTSTRDALMQARMLPLGEIFGRFHRVLQPLEIRHNKQVTLELSGTEVLVDKVVAEKLYDPLLHLVRNAFDHGIESLEVRQQHKKPDFGQIELSASQSGRHLVIEVRDDGKGLDFERIRQRAVERQLISEEQAIALDEGQLINLLFEPGFSTVSGVSELSGRGVGLDVVRAQLQALQGSITVYSEPYRGTTFSLQIPLNLTITKLLLCQAGGQNYAFFVDAIEQILIPQAHQLRCWEGGKVLRWNKDTSSELGHPHLQSRREAQTSEQLIPIYQLSKVLNYSSEVANSLVFQSQQPFVPEGQMMPIILIRYQDRFMGLEVDQLIGEQELVIRPLGAMIVPPHYVYGSSILADGRLTLVLDGAALMQYVSEQQAASSTDSSPDRYTDNALTYLTASRANESSTHSLSSSSQEQRLLPAAPNTDAKVRRDKLILLVDDSITLRQTLALTLQKAGYRVLQAKDGYEAIEQLRQHREIQLVICDIEMPRMNGFEFLKYRQQDSVLADIPVVMLTSRSASKHRLIATELGATAYITKPYLEQMLLATLTDAIENNTRNSISI
ncbi:MAG: hybrid sensor histidine kinase/response regulator, partial [Microcoleus sp. SIO2G3]|nr:hybrid sensor histidine kinase/response regulator [Microcoleus sp. SIO2G3]